MMLQCLLWYGNERTKTISKNVGKNCWYAPIGLTDDGRSITQEDVRRALAFRTFWIVLHIVTCCAIIAGNGRTLGFW